MKINMFSFTFWFNIYNSQKELISDIVDNFQGEFEDIKVFDENNDLFSPIIISENEKKNSNFSMSKINFQYNLHNTNFKSIEEFRKKTLDIYDLLTKNSVEILHTALYINGEFIDKDARKTLTKNLVSSKLLSDDLIDLTLKFSKKHEDSFFKIVSFLNKKQLTIKKSYNEEGVELPLPIISWKDAEVGDELIEVAYEINDRYLFDNEKNYHTTEFHLNKMLYLLEFDFKDDIGNLIKKGEF